MLSLIGMEQDQEGAGGQEERASRTQTREGPVGQGKELGLDPGSPGNSEGFLEGVWPDSRI